MRRVLPNPHPKSHKQAPARQFAGEKLYRKLVKVKAGSDDSSHDKKEGTAMITVWGDSNVALGCYIYNRPLVQAETRLGSLSRMSLMYSR